ncbi:MmgE/PrpD family protein [Azospirillum sp. ST 5-10]|uniref:MmgE/PrpD family protein n=1 Tax=unclassified Azospirillum TaxID=2630922 RepID=UPI003F4A46E6
MNALADPATTGPSPAAAGVTERLARFAADLAYEALPPAVAEQARRSLLDTVGVALAGAAVGEGFREAVSWALAEGGRPRARLWATGQALGTTQAAFCNTLHARALDYDDITEFPQVHVSVCVVPAALAAAESLGRPVDGRTLLAAVVAGSEVQARLTAAIAPAFDATRFPVTLATQIFGYFAAAAAAGRVLGLDADGMRNAFGLAMMQATGTEEMVVHATRSAGKCLYAGFSNQGGVQAALMARHGVPALGEPLAGQAGLLAAFYGGRGDRDALTAGLGERYRCVERCVKGMPGTLVAHAFVEAALSILRDHALSAGDVERVVLRVGGWGRAMCEPAGERRAPPSAAAAMNSIPFLVAKALVNGAVALEDMSAAGRGQPAALAMARRIDHEHDPSLDTPHGLEPGVVEIRTGAGGRFRARVDKPRGHPARPLSFEEVAGKFHRNAALASHDEATAGRIVELVGRLDGVADVRTLVDAVIPPGAARQERQS